jgi:hypothetical protein
MAKSLAQIMRFGSAGAFDQGAKQEEAFNFKGPHTANMNLATGKQNVKESAQDVVGMLPEVVDVFTPDPVAELSSLGAMTAEQRALSERKGLETTKIVQKSLLNAKKRETLGTVV